MGVYDKNFEGNDRVITAPNCIWKYIAVSDVELFTMCEYKKFKHNLVLKPEYSWWTRSVPQIPVTWIHASCAWWRLQMETFSALLALCARNSLVTGEFPAQRPVTRSFDVFFDLRLNKRLSKQWWGWWFETPLHALWRHCIGPSTTMVFN